MPTSEKRTRIAYLAPWVDLGGSDKGTIDWFRCLDRERFAASLVTTQPSANRRVTEVAPYAEEVWNLPDLMPGDDMPHFVLELLQTRGIQVLHIMNSRLAYDLLPDIAALERPPVVVVQLHVEEEDRSGYVRYVTTRYGNLVDAYSVTSHHLARAMHDYDVPRDKLRVIHTGVDAEAEFSPDHVTPHRLPTERFNVLYPGRLVEQKDPLLMVEVARAVAAARPDALFHVVGDGVLEPDVRAAVDAAGIAGNVVFHGPSNVLAPWYGAADALLMTSRFEGVPYTVYEAMAMGLPVVVPALPGNVELLDGVGGTLVTPRDDVSGYADALLALAADDAHRRRVGGEARARMRSEFRLDTMARKHEALYEELLERRAARGRPPLPELPERGKELAVEPIPLARPSRGRPLVSVVIPCFNHGLFLDDCLSAIEAQEYPALEVIVVDDASTDPGTIAVLDEIEAAGRARVLRREVNGGPSRARNAAIDEAKGRYVLPVDSDNLLLPGAIASLVEQLQSSSARVGFVYPTVQYFGTRTDLFKPPPYDLHALRRGNFCDTCSLFDRAIFDAGIRFAEDIELGHEDWDLALQLAERGVYGEPAHDPVLGYRKHGFTRADTVEYASVAFHEEIAERHVELGDDPTIKPRWSAGLSVVLLDPVDGDERVTALAAALERQTLEDVEVLAAFDGHWRDPVRHVRRLPPALGLTRSEIVEHAFTAARAPRVLFLTGAGLSLLDDPAGLEKVVRGARPVRGISALALIDVGDARPPFAPVQEPSAVERPVLGAALFLDREATWPERVVVGPGQELEDVLRAIEAADGLLSFHHLPAAEAARVLTAPSTIRLRRPRVRTSGEEHLRVSREREGVRTPGWDVPRPRRWLLDLAWLPPETWPLVRHRDERTGRRTVTNDHAPPPGHVIEMDLGVVHRFSPPGTVRLEVEDGVYRAVDREAKWPEPGGETRVLGHLDAAAFPMLVPLLLGTHRPTGEQLLLCGDGDPLLGECDVHATLGFIDGFPIRPLHRGPAAIPDYGVVGLVRHLDPAARRHSYTVGDAGPDATRVGELGALLRVPQEDTVPVWLTPEGRLRTEREAAPAARPEPRTLARWAVAPAAWRDIPLVPRARSVARRAVDVPRFLLAGRPNGAVPERPAGYLHLEPGIGRLPLFAVDHPVTGDQLLSTSRFEAVDLGYGEPRLLGHLRERAPVTGSLALHRKAIPWAAKFGQKVRVG